MSRSALFAAELYLFIAEAIAVPNFGIYAANLSTERSATGPSAEMISGDKLPKRVRFETIDNKFKLPVIKSDICGPDILIGERKAVPL